MREFEICGTNGAIIFESLFQFKGIMKILYTKNML